MDIHTELILILCIKLLWVNSTFFGRTAIKRLKVLFCIL